MNVGSGTAAFRIASALGAATARRAGEIAGLAGISGDNQSGAASAVGSMQASRNVSIGLALTQTADGLLGEAANIVQRVRELGVQASTETLSSEQRGFIEAETKVLSSQLLATLRSARFNGTELLATDGNSATSIRIQTGPAATNTLDIDRPDLRDVLPPVSGFAMPDRAGALATVEAADKLLARIGSARSYFGAQSNALESTERLASNAAEAAAEMYDQVDQDVIQFTSTQLARDQILVNGATALLAQANLKSKDVLDLLQSV